jgi:hypothetical protein
LHLRTRELMPGLICAPRACSSTTFLTTKPSPYLIRHGTSSEFVKKVKAILAVAQEEEGIVEG